MTSAQFADFAETIVFVFGPWAGWLLAVMLAVCVFVAIGLIFLALLARMTRAGP